MTLPFYPCSKFRERHPPAFLHIQEKTDYLPLQSFFQSAVSFLSMRFQNVERISHCYKLIYLETVAVSTSVMWSTPLGFMKRTYWRLLTFKCFILLQSKHPKIILLLSSIAVPWSFSKICLIHRFDIQSHIAHWKQKRAWFNSPYKGRIPTGLCLSCAKNSAWLNCKCIIHSSALIFNRPHDKKLCWIDFDVLFWKYEHLILYNIVKDFT